MIRAIRNRYFARSAPGRADHGAERPAGGGDGAVDVLRRRPQATSARTSSVAGLTVLNMTVPADELAVDEQAVRGREVDDRAGLGGGCVIEHLDQSTVK